VISPHIKTANRSLNGLMALVLVMATAQTCRGCASVLSLPASYWLDRNEDHMHPGKGSATT